MERLTDFQHTNKQINMCIFGMSKEKKNKESGKKLTNKNNGQKLSKSEGGGREEGKWAYNF